VFFETSQSELSAHSAKETRTNRPITVLEAAYLFGRQHNLVRPFPLGIAAGDFTFAAGHLRNAISFVAGTLNSAAAFSIAGFQICFGLCDPPHNSPELG
jgi:hypothetical protein